MVIKPADHDEVQVLDSGMSSHHIIQVDQLVSIDSQQTLVLPPIGIRKRMDALRQRVGKLMVPGVSWAIAFALFTVLNIVWTRFDAAREQWVWYDYILSVWFYVWTFSFPMAVVNLYGYVACTDMMAPFSPAQVPLALKTPIHWRIVTRGTNADALHHTVQKMQQIIREFMVTYHCVPVIHIEIVTDQRLALETVAQYVVPPTYQTPSGARYKARALHYALDMIDIQPNAWILHFDEESHPTRSLVEGMLLYVQQEIEAMATGAIPAIGQGAILYHRDLAQRPFLSLADSIRTGLDYGYFRVQYHKWHKPYFGMHGSFILVHQQVERFIGFDFDPWRSITEDAYWALRACDRGIPVKWVHGYLSEQATFTMMDFLKQRKRWFTGLFHVVRASDIKLKTRVVLYMAILFWATAFLGCTITYIHFFFPIQVPWWIQIPMSFSTAVFIGASIYGLLVNTREHGIAGKVVWCVLLPLQLILSPIFSLMEALAMTWGVLTLHKVQFHIVKKS